MSRKSKRIQPLWKKYPVICAFIAIVILALLIILPIGAATDWTFKFNNTSAPSKPTSAPTSAPSKPTSAPSKPTSAPTSAPSKPTSAPTSSPTPIPSNALTDANIRQAVEDYFSNNQNTKNSVIAKYGDMPVWDVSRVTDMSYLFSGRNNIPDITEWKTSGAQTMAYMFKQASYFNHDISNWDVSNVSDMSGMFYYASAFNQPIQKWNTKSLLYMVEMLAYASTFDQTLCWGHSNINTLNWNVGSNAKWCVLDDNSIRTAVQDYFSNDQNVKNSVIDKYGDMPDWDVSRVTDMSSLFSGRLNIPNIAKWNTSKVTDMHQMFYSADTFNENITDWDVSNVTDMSAMFSYASAFNQPIQKWNTKSLKNMLSMFYLASAFNQTLCWEHSNIVTLNWNVNSNAKWC